MQLQQPLYSKGLAAVRWSPSVRMTKLLLSLQVMHEEQGLQIHLIKSSVSFKMMDIAPAALAFAHHLHAAVV